MENKHIDLIVEVNKGIDEITHVEKFNPYHDERGRFASASGYASFTFRTRDPKKQHMADMAAAREKERSAAASANNPEKRIASAESSLKSMLRDGAEVKLTGMDPDLADGVVNNVKTILDRYPGVKNAFGGFTMDEPHPGYFTDNKSVFACFSPATEKIHFNSERFKNRSELEEACKGCVERKHWPEGTTADSIAVHEMGHAIDLYVSVKTVGQYRAFWGGETISQRMWNNDIKAGKKKGEPVTGKSIKEGLSGYASSHCKEYFAEGFSEYITSPSPRKMAQSIGKRMETYIKKIDKKEGV